MGSKFTASYIDAVRNEQYLNQSKQRATTFIRSVEVNIVKTVQELEAKRVIGGDPKLAQPYEGRPALRTATDKLRKGMTLQAFYGWELQKDLGTEVQAM